MPMMSFTSATLPSGRFMIGTAMCALGLIFLATGAARAQAPAAGGTQATPTPPTTPPRTTPPPPRPAAPTTRQGDLLTSLFGPQRSPFVRQRLTRVPDMFGDSIGPAATLAVTELTIPGVNGGIDLPLSGALSRLNVSDFNKALPVDRVFFNYNHFHNALRRSYDTETASGIVANGGYRSIDRYTFGIEKTFFDRQSSLELRLPLLGNSSFSTTPDPLTPDATTSVSTGAVGNVSLILKQLLYADDYGSIAAGLGIETPSGDDTQARVNTARYTIENDAVHLHPWLGFLSQPDGEFFLNGFAHLDVPLNGNDLRRTGVGGTPAPSGPIGEFNEQTVLRLDLGGGVWLIGPHDTGDFRSLAGIVELHYATALDDTDRVTAVDGATTVDVFNSRNRFDVLNLTAGLQSQFFGGTFVRVAASAPLRQPDNRFFDAEVLFSVMQLY
jgi:hypothetical protein